MACNEENKLWDVEQGSVIPAFFEEIQNLQQAKTLLEDIWREIGPYRSRGDVIADKTWSKVQDYFKFDDSE